MTAPASAAVGVRDGPRAVPAAVGRPDPGATALAALGARRRAAAPRGDDRARALCEALDSPHLAVPAIHVAGTDGKTSVVRIVAALLAALGVRAGDTTSPHLQDVRERIRVAGRPLADARLTAACAPLPAALTEAERRVGEPPTFFDAVTAVALWALADAAVEVAVVEAGIGGAGDATNVVQGRVAVLTPIGLDHPELGTSHAEVAAEKAGIIQPGGVVVVGAQVPAAATAIARAAGARGATLPQAGRDFGVRARRATADGQVVDLCGLRGSRLRAWLPLLGAHQAANAATALAAVQAFLATTRLPVHRLRRGFAAARVPGRVELVRRPGTATVVLDGAHDPLAVRALLATLRELAHPGPRVVVLGVSGGRDPVALAAPLRELGALVVTTAASAPGATPAERLARRLWCGGVAALPVPGPGRAVEEATRLAGARGLVVVTGSLHLVGEARTALGRARR